MIERFGLGANFTMISILGTFGTGLKSLKVYKKQKG